MPSELNMKRIAIKKWSWDKLIAKETNVSIKMVRKGRMDVNVGVKRETIH
jgi:hypothetical protein